MSRASRKSKTTTIALPILLTVGILIVDLQAALGVAVPVTYVAVIWAVHRAHNTVWIWLAALVCSCLTVATLWFTPETDVFWKVLLNRSLAVGVILLTAIQCSRYIRLERIRRRLYEELEERVRLRTLELQQAKEELEVSNTELQEFAYVVSHDLKNPLRTISGFAEFLREDCGGQMGDQADGHIERIIHGTNRMKRLIDDLLSYAQVDADRRPFVDVDLNHVVDNTIHTLHAALESSGGAVTRTDLPVVQGDETQLTRLTQNLLGNGLKYHADDPPRIHVSAAKTDDHWNITFADNGIGIAPESQDKIFEVFHRLHGEQDYPGTGIGLAICRRIVQGHRGEIRVESQPGEGCRFVVTLPVANGDSETPPDPGTDAEDWL